ncbi:MAG: peroxiredoxin [Verrucomicrobia bacterium]|nr:peroxiredoxin [Verrucomicrobiota bacterium]
MLPVPSVANAMLSFFGLTSSNALPVGAKIPDLRAIDHEGQPIDLGAACRQGLVLVYFYPKADTPGCTAQACTLRDAFADLSEEGLTIFGVSIDSPKSQAAFRKRYQIPFTLIADEEGKVAEAFGVPTLLGLAAKRQSFLLRDGVVAWRDVSASPRNHADDVREAIRNLRSAAG